MTGHNSWLYAWFPVVLIPSLALAGHIQVQTYGCDPTAVVPLKSAEQFVICDECGTNAEASAETLFRQKYPKVKYDSFSETGISGVYEVSRPTGSVYYAPPDYLFFGEIWEGIRPLAQARRAKMESSELENLPLDKAIKIGDGQNIVVEFTDPDCPYCRRADAWLKSRKDITRYVFLFPLESIHPTATTKAQLILCSSNPAGEYERVMSGSMDTGHLAVSAVCRDKADAPLADSVHAGRRLGVRSTPTFWVNGRRVSGANVPMIEKFLAMETKK